MPKPRARVLTGIAGFAATLVEAIYAINGPALRFHVWKVVSGKARGSKYVNINGISIYYETYGAGPPVLVLHGGLDSIESSFKTWASEQTRFPREIIEVALSHQVGGKLENAYQRGDLLEKRRQLMNAWAQYCSKVPISADVVALRTAP